jgi:hypothetical protein
MQFRFPLPSVCTAPPIDVDPVTMLVLNVQKEMEREAEPVQEMLPPFTAPALFEKVVPLNVSVPDVAVVLLVLTVFGGATENEETKEQFCDVN